MPLFWEITISFCIALLFSPLWVFYLMALRGCSDAAFSKALKDGRVIIRFTVMRGIFFDIKPIKGCRDD